MKTCLRCDTPKPIEDFYKHPKMADGRLGKCRECCKKEASKRRSEKAEEIRLYERGRANLPQRVAAREKYFQDHQFGTERRARLAVSNALRDGRLVKTPCEVCGTTKVEAHHNDYAKPLEVNWLCKKHHVDADKIRRANDIQRSCTANGNDGCAGNSFATPVQDPHGPQVAELSHHRR